MNKWVDPFFVVGEAEAGMSGKRHFDLVACKVQIGGGQYTALVDTGSNTSIFGLRVKEGAKVAEGVVSFATQQLTCDQIRFEADQIRLNGIGVPHATEGYRTDLGEAIPNFPVEHFDLLVGTNLLMGLCIEVGPEPPLRVLGYDEAAPEGYKELRMTSCHAGSSQTGQTYFGPLFLVGTNRHGFFLVDTGNSFTTFCNTGETDPSCAQNLGLVFADGSEVALNPVAGQQQEEGRVLMHPEPLSMQMIQNCRDRVNVRGNVGVEVWCGLQQERGVPIERTRFCFAPSGQTSDGHKIFCRIAQKQADGSLSS